MSPRAQVYILGLLLIAIGAGVVIYKREQLGLPIIPGEYRTVWTIEAKVEFQAQGEPVKTSLALPKSQGNMAVIDEIFSSSGYGFNIDNQAGHRRAVWTIREAGGKQALYYKLDVYQLSEPAQHVPISFSTTVQKPDWAGTRNAAQRSAAASIIQQSWDLSSDRGSFAGQLLRKLNDPRNRDGILVRTKHTRKQRVQLALDMFALANIPAHIVRGIYLEDDRSRLNASELVEIHDGEFWQIFDPLTGEQGLPENFMIWQRGDRSMIDIEGGRRSKVTFSVLANDVPAREAALKRVGTETSAILDYSIYSLPIEQQSIFKFILLVPVGALVVILLRVVVGIRTAGTFMPVLLAIAFVQTSLLTGVGIFLLILAVGLWVRSYLSRLDLLLVSRIAAVVVIVVGLMSIISVVSYKLGIEQALTVTFFPMIIVAWTIEHMSILWEDDGPVEVLVQTAGSLVVAVLCYQAMTNRFVEHWMFNFPELLLVLLGFIIMLGHYTGYRLSELHRFRHMRVE